MPLKSQCETWYFYTPFSRIIFRVIMLKVLDEFGSF